MYKSQHLTWFHVWKIKMERPFLCKEHESERETILEGPSPSFLAHLFNTGTRHKPEILALNYAGFSRNMKKLQISQQRSP
jgi:hypothetical protein